MALVLALAGCGDSNDDIPRQDAAELVVLVQNIREQVDSESCEAAIASSLDLDQEVQRLDSDDVPDDVINALSAGIQRLESLVIQDCGTVEDETTPEETDTDDEETTPEETTPEETTPEETDPDGEETTPEETDPDGEETTPEETNGTGGTGDGGTGAPGGGDDDDGGGGSGDED